MNTKQRGTMTGQELKSIRKMLGFKNQEPFADRVGISHSTLCHLETGKKEMPLVTQRAVEQVCYQELYGIPPEKCIEALMIKMGAK